jgi:hypothetical protein
MSSALGWHYHNMLWGIVIYCLSKYEDATSELLHILAKFNMNIMQLKQLEIYNF